MTESYGFDDDMNHLDHNGLIPRLELVYTLVSLRTSQKDGRSYLSTNNRSSTPLQFTTHYPTTTPAPHQSLDRPSLPKNPSTALTLTAPCTADLSLPFCS